MTRIVQSFPIADLAALRHFARALAAQLVPGDMLLLEGTLGVGKTELCRALIRALPDEQGRHHPEEPVPSPTFTLVQSYLRAIGLVQHYDLYRLSSPDELFELGWEDALSGGLTLVEWPERLGSLRPDKAMTITIGVPPHQHTTKPAEEARLILVDSPRPLLLAPPSQGASDPRAAAR